MRRRPAIKEELHAAIVTFPPARIIRRTLPLIRRKPSRHLRGYFRATARELYIGLACNKNLLSKATVSKNFEGLLHPALKSRVGLTHDHTSYKVMDATVRTKSPEFIKRLKGQELGLHPIIPRALLNLIASGEVLAGPAIFRNLVKVAIGKGTPVDWVPLDVVPTNVGGAAMAFQPPHFHAALLLASYLFGPGGQGVLENYHYGDRAKNYGFKKSRPEHGMSTEKYEKELARWEKLLRVSDAKELKRTQA